MIVGFVLIERSTGAKSSLRIEIVSELAKIRYCGSSTYHAQHPANEARYNRLLKDECIEVVCHHISQTESEPSESPDRSNCLYFPCKFREISNLPTDMNRDFTYTTF